MTGTPKGLLLASIHDVSPRFESEIDQLLDLLLRHVGTRPAMLVVPNHWGDAPIVPGSAFATRLRAWSDCGTEIFLHGFYHCDGSPHDDAFNRLRARVMTAGEGEFLALDRRAAAGRIHQGRSIIEDVIGRPIAGFVAPAWLYGRGALEALCECSIPLAEDHWRVWCPATGERLARGPVITWASRTPLRLASSLAAAALLRRFPSRVLRIGVHPPDIKHSRLVESIERTLRKATRSHTGGRYSELLTART